MIGKGWSTCRSYRGTIVTPSTRHDHLSHQSYPALLPEHRQWIPDHHPCCYLCLTARKKKIKAQLQGGTSAQLFPVSKTWESPASGRKRRLLSSSPQNRSILTKPLHTCSQTRTHTHTHKQPPLPFVFRWFCLQSILPLKSKWVDSKCRVLHVERQEGA